MKKYIVIEIGCLECGVSTQIAGVFDTEKEANDKAQRLGDWREGGQRTNNKKEYYQLYYKHYYKSDTYLKARAGYVLKAKEKRRALRELLKENSITP